MPQDIGRSAQQTARPLRVIAWAALLLSMLQLLVAPSFAEDSALDIRVTQMSLEELLDIDITTVSKRKQKVHSAPAAVYVLTSEDIRRSGARSLPELLRLVPGVSVARIDNNKWSVSIRGFSNRTAAKLLVLIDGRSVYNQLFSGVFWEAQDVFLPDIERIEVIRGPGGTLWGANAVNGVINIITKSAKESVGGLVQGGGGSEERAFGGVRYGWQNGEQSWLRGYAKYYSRDDGYPSYSSEDESHRGQAGFRSDTLLNDSDTLTIQGDAYDGEAGERLGPEQSQDVDLRGTNLVAEWSRVLKKDARLQLRGYWDYYDYDSVLLRERRHTGDLELLHDFLPAERHRLNWGLVYRITGDSIDSSELIGVDPESRTDHLVSVFAQDEFSIRDDLILVAGAKLDYNTYTRWEVQPNVRLSYFPTTSQTIWAAVSRAVRTPSRLEDDIAAGVLQGSRSFDAEVLNALEAGYRVELSSTVSLDLAGFYNIYDELLTIENGLVDNNMHGHAMGGEALLRWQPLERLRLEAAYTHLRLDMELNSASVDTAAPDRIEGADPDHIVTLRSLWQPADAWELDSSLRFFDNLPALRVPSYLVLDVRLGWRPRPDLALSLVGQNLLEERHFEQTGLMATEVQQGFYVQATYTF